jgi:hypothetical protein
VVFASALAHAEEDPIGRIGRFLYWSSRIPHISSGLKSWIDWRAFGSLKRRHQRKGAGAEGEGGRAARESENGGTRAATVTGTDTPTEHKTRPNRRQQNDSTPIFCYIHTMNDNEIKRHIADRNGLRGESGLPLLSIESETTRLRKARAGAEFEQYYRSHPEKYVYDPDRNILENAGQYSIRRNQLRKTFNAERGL